MARSTSRERSRWTARGLAALAFAGLSAPARAASPELSVDTPYVDSPSSPTAQKIAFSARVANLGTAGSPTTKVRYYRSTDSTITSADTRVVTQNLDPISAGRYRVVAADLTVGTKLGRFWFGACVDPVAGEANAGNNCSAGVPVQVGPRPDVAASQITVVPAAVSIHGTVDTRALVTNVGTGASGVGWVDFDYVPESVPSATWQSLDSAAIPPLAAGASIAVTARASLDEYPGRYRLRGCVQGVPFDGSTANDCAEGVLIVDGPDLEATDTTVDDATPSVDRPFVVGATIRNGGTLRAQARQALVMFAETADWIRYGVQLGQTTVPALDPGAVFQLADTVSFSSLASGYVAVCLVSGFEENPANDCSPPVRLVVGGVRIDYDSTPLRVGATNRILGRGFTPGTVLQLYVATPNGVASYGPYTPTLVGDTALDLDLPASVVLGNGFASLEAINTDQGYERSLPQCRNLLGGDDQGPPSLEGIGGAGLQFPDCTIPLASIHAALPPGSAVDLEGRLFANPRLNLFTPSGNLGPLEPDAGWTSTHASFQVPADAPVGPVTVQLVNAPYAGNVESNAVLAAVGQAISIDSVSQNGSEITVTGAGFSSATVINFFNWDGSSLTNLGGLTQGGVARIPLANLTSSGFSFQRPAGAVAGKAYVQALNPPFVPATSTGNDPHGAFDLQ